MQQTPAYWDGTRWIVHSHSPLSRGQLSRVARYLINVQRQRRLEMRPGAKRDELDATIRALRDGRIVCGVTPEYSGPDGRGYTPFAASAGTGKIIVGAG